MSRGFLRRQDVGYEKKPNPRNIYGVKHFSNTDPAALQAEVNAYLFALPTANVGWSPHLVEVHHLIGGNAAPVPADTTKNILFTFGDAKDNSFLRYGNERMDATNGFVVPFDGKLTISTFSQKDPAAALVGLIVNGVAQNVLPITSEQHIFPLDVDVVVGDIVTMENISDVGLKESTFSTILEYGGAPAPPPPVGLLLYHCWITIYVDGTVETPPAV